MVVTNQDMLTTSWRVAWAWVACVRGSNCALFDLQLALRVSTRL